MSSPEISVVLPTHEVEPWLAECLSSILDDQDVDLEVIAVDDASTDGTLDLLHAWAARDPRLRVVPNEGRGGAEARNLGVRLARGEYLVFCDGDDLVPRGAYRAMLDSARANDADLVIGPFLKFFPTRTWWPTRDWPAFDRVRTGTTLLEQPSLLRNRACWNRLFRRSFWLDSAITFPSVPRSNDVVPMTRALLAARRINVIDKAVYLYRSRPGASSMTARARGIDSFLSYLGQEAESFRLTGGVAGQAGGTELRALHESLFLVNDGWVHLRNFLAATDIDACTPDELADAARSLAGLVQQMSPEALDALPTDRRWCFRLAVAGEWRLARQVVAADVGGMAGVLADLTALSASGTYDEGSLREVLEHAVLRPLASRTEPAVDVADALLAHRDVLGLIRSRADARDLPAGAQHLLGVVRGGDRAALVDLLGQVPLRFAFRRVTTEPAGPVVRVIHAGPWAEDLAFAVAAGGASHALPPVDVRRGAEPLMAALPVRRLAGREWSLRVTGTFDGVAVDAPVALSPVGDRAGSAEGHALSFGRTPAGGALIAVGPPRWRRAAGRVRRALRPSPRS